jgi:hypothetical protein
MAAKVIFVNVVNVERGYTFDDFCATYDVAEDYAGDVDAAFAEAGKYYEAMVAEFANDATYEVKFFVFS